MTELPPRLPGTKRRELCPYCMQDELHRSHRRWWERVVGRQPVFRCSNCRKRFSRHRIVFDSVPENSGAGETKKTGGDAVGGQD